jgi:hypothetical protein
MKCGHWITLAALAVGAALALSASGLFRSPLDLAATARAADAPKPAAKPAAQPAKKPGGLPPLKVDRSAPLLLEDAPKPKPAVAHAGPVADNSACLCCHTNYETEPMAVSHALENVGCVKCHGQSYAHRDDEDNVTPPDVMYPADKIDKSCDECHDEHDAPAKEVIARWQERCPKKTDPKTLVCTDCHGQHRLKFRTVWWDRKTRKLIVRKEGQRILMRYDPTKGKKHSPAANVQGRDSGKTAQGVETMQ